MPMERGACMVDARRLHDVSVVLRPNVIKGRVTLFP
jgi:hypothetical protein